MPVSAWGERPLSKAGRRGLDPIHVDCWTWVIRGMLSKPLALGVTFASQLFLADHWETPRLLCVKEDKKGGSSYFFPYGRRNAWLSRPWSVAVGGRVFLWAFYWFRLNFSSCCDDGIIHLIDLFVFIFFLPPFPTWWIQQFQMMLWSTSTEPSKSARSPNFSELNTASWLVSCLWTLSFYRYRVLPNSFRLFNIAYIPLVPRLFLDSLI